MATLALENHTLMFATARVHLTLVEALLACDQTEEACARLTTQALAWLMARADTFESAEGRAAFLTQVPAHAQLVELGQRVV